VDVDRVKAVVYLSSSGFCVMASNMLRAAGASLAGRGEVAKGVSEGLEATFVEVARRDGLSSGQVAWLVRWIRREYD
jgi:hypothetical protein